MHILRVETKKKKFKQLKMKIKFKNNKLINLIIIINLVLKKIIQLINIRPC